VLNAAKSFDLPLFLLLKQFIHLSTTLIFQLSFLLENSRFKKLRPTQTAEMDVDGDVDSQLLQQFSSMATTDREVLIAEFQRLLGNQLSDAGCAFFLDMNNWQGIIMFSHR